MVVYTCGTFDMFHVGHLNILRCAKSFGEKLIVGVSTDELVESYKPGVLVVPFEQRVEIVSSIKYVDECVPQTNLDKFLAWEQIRYDILVVGDDWKGAPSFQVYESKLREVGARVEYLPYTPDVSSTQIRRILEGRGVAKYVASA